MRLLALTFLATALALAQHKIDYLILEGSVKEGIEEKLTEAAAEGYRFVDVVWRVSASLKGTQITVFMQKKPGDAPERVQYKVIRRGRIAKLKEDLAEAGEQGYSIAGVATLETSYVVVLRRPEALEPSCTGQAEGTPCVAPKQ